jgi:hypothetical protein
MEGKGRKKGGGKGRREKGRGGRVSFVLPAFKSKVASLISRHFK